MTFSTYGSYNPSVNLLNNTMPQGADFALNGEGNGSYGYDTAVSSGYDQASALRNRNRYSNPSDVNIDTQNDPGQDYAFGRASDYEKNVAAGTNEETVRELQRARDEISAGMMKEGEAAGARGANPSLFRTRSLESGKRYVADVQGRMADVSLGRRAQAIGLVSGAANSRADSTRAMHLGTAAQRLNEQRLELDAADQQARLQEQPFNRMMSLANLALSHGFTMGGGGFSGRSSGAGSVHRPMFG